MKKVRIIYIVALLLLILLYIYFNDAAALAFLITAGLLPFCSALSTRLIRSKVEVSWDKTVKKKDKKQSIVIHITNHSRIPLRRVQARLCLANELTGEKQYQTLELEVLDGKSQSFSVEMKAAHCGSMELSLQKLSLCDWLLLYRCSLPSPNSRWIVVLPDIFSMQVNVAQNSTYEDACEEYATEHAGYDKTEIYDLKEYQLGNSMHDIHWKLSSKRDELIVKEGSEPIEQSVFLLWNVKRRAGKQEIIKQQAMAEVFVSMAAALCDMGIMPEIGWYNSRRSELEYDTIESSEELPVLAQKFLISHSETEEAWLQDSILQEKRHIVSISQDYEKLLAQAVPGQRITQLVMLDEKKEARLTKTEGVTVIGFHYDNKEQELWQLDV